MKKNYKSLVSAELLLLKQKAKVEWLGMDDLNTKFFHAKMREKNAKQRIDSILNSQGVVVTEEKDIANAFLLYYEELLGTKDSNLREVDSSVIAAGPVLNDNQKECLLAPVSNEEVKEAVFSMLDCMS